MFDQKIPPMLAYKVEDPFDSPEYIYEIKWDGTRCLLFYRKGEVKIQNRRLIDVTYRYPELKEGLKQSLGEREVILDGELVVLKDGRPHFPLLQEREHVLDPFRAQILAKITPATYIAFDILYMDGRPLLEIPLRDRKEILREAVKESDLLILSRHVEQRGVDFYNRVIEEGFEGAMAKKKNSPYLPGKRSRFWLKIKPRDREICYVIGFTEGRGERKGTFGALLLATRVGEDWAFRGKVGSGFSREDLDKIRKLLDPLRVDTPPIEGLSPSRGVQWVKPFYRCEITYQERSTRGKFRAPVFRRMLP